PPVAAARPRSSRPRSIARSRSAWSSTWPSSSQNQMAWACFSERACMNPVFTTVTPKLGASSMKRCASARFRCPCSTSTTELRVIEIEESVRPSPSSTRRNSSTRSSLSLARGSQASVGSTWSTPSSLTWRSWEGQMLEEASTMGVPSEVVLPNESMLAPIDQFSAVNIVVPSLNVTAPSILLDSLLPRQLSDGPLSAGPRTSQHGPPPHEARRSRSGRSPIAPRLHGLPPCRCTTRSALGNARRGRPSTLRTNDPSIYQPYAQSVTQALQRSCGARRAPRSEGRHPAVHAEDRTGRVGGFVAREVDHDPSDVLRCARTAQRGSTDDPCTRIGVLGDGGDQRGLCIAGDHGVHPDPIGRVTFRSRAHQRMDAALGGAVCRELSTLPVESGGAAGADDRSAAPTEECPDSVLDGEKGAGQVDGEGTAPCVEGHVRYLRILSEQLNAGVRDDDVRCGV